MYCIQTSIRYAGIILTSRSPSFIGQTISLIVRCISKSLMNINKNHIKNQTSLDLVMIIILTCLLKP